MQAEDRFDVGRRIAQSSLDHRAHDRTRVRDRHPLAHPIRTADPTRVEHPHLRVVTVDAIDEHVGVCLGWQDEEWRREAGAEDGLGLGHATLGAGDLRRVAGQEVVADLAVVETGHRRQHAIGVGGQEDHVARMAADS